MLAFAPMPFLSAKLSLDPQQALGVLATNVQASAGVAVSGPAAAYALVWEFGNLRQTKKGPKTVMGVNLQTGEAVWLSSQAPTGYVRSNVTQFWEIIRTNLKLLDLSSEASVAASLNTIVNMSAEQIKDVIADAAPVDSGELRAAIYVVKGTELGTVARASAALLLE